MYSMYILKSRVKDRYYIGSAEDAVERLDVHNGSHAKWTKRCQPWDIVYQELFATRGEAVQRERELKALKNISKYLEKIQKGEL